MRFRSDEQRRAMFAKLNSDIPKGESLKDVPKVVSKEVAVAKQPSETVEVGDSGVSTSFETVSEEKIQFPKEETEVKYDEPLTYKTTDDFVHTFNVPETREDLEKEFDILRDLESGIHEEPLISKQFPLPSKEDLPSILQKTGGEVDVIVDGKTVRVKTSEEEFIPEELKRARSKMRADKLREDIREYYMKKLPYKQQAEKIAAEKEQEMQKIRDYEIRRAMEESPAGFVRGVAEYGKRGFVKGAAEEIGRESVGLGSAVASVPKEAVLFPGRAISKTGRVAGQVVKEAGRTAEQALAPGALAFGMTAGQGVSDIIAEAGDIIEAPKREFWMPPGTQKVWTGSRYETRQVLRPPLEPWAFNKALGIQQPMGVSPTVAGVVPTAASEMPLYGSYGARTLYGREDVPVWGKLDMAAGTTYTPRLAVPNFYRLGSERVPKWLVPPSEMLYGRQKEKQVAVQRATRYPVSLGPSGGVVSPSVDEYTQVSKIGPQKIMTKLPVQRIKKDIRPMKAPFISRNVSRVESSKKEFDELAASLGSSHPSVKQAEAKLQSQYEYASKHVPVGSYSEMKLQETGVSPVMG